MNRVYDASYLFTISHNPSYGYWVTVENHEYKPRALNKENAVKAVNLLSDGFSPTYVADNLKLF